MTTETVKEISKYEIPLQTLTSGHITARRGTYTHGVPEPHKSKQCRYVINSFCFDHPRLGTVMIDAGFSKDFYDKPPYGNLNMIMKFFHKINDDQMHLIVGDAELTKLDVDQGFYVNSDYGKKGESDVRDSADRIRSFAKKYPEAVLHYSHDL